jgi:hypothetical protein
MPKQASILNIIHQGNALKEINWFKSNPYSEFCKNKTKNKNSSGWTSRLVLDSTSLILSMYVSQ